MPTIKELFRDIALGMIFGLIIGFALAEVMMVW